VSTCFPTPPCLPWVSRASVPCFCQSTYSGILILLRAQPQPKDAFGIWVPYLSPCLWLTVEVGEVHQRSPGRYWPLSQTWLPMTKQLPFEGSVFSSPVASEPKDNSFFLPQKFTPRSLVPRWALPEAPLHPISLPQSQGRSDLSEGLSCHPAGAMWLQHFEDGIALLQNCPRWATEQYQAIPKAVGPTWLTQPT
jgi:hypothetical protein